MTRKPDRSFFRGAELGRLLLLAVVMVAGWIAVFVYCSRPGAPPPPPPRTALHLVPLPPADAGPEFQGVQDRRPLSLRDNAAYAELLRRVRTTSYDDLARQCRRDVFFSQLIDAPQRYRGLPIHLEGTVLRVLRQETPGSRLFPGGAYFEAYAITPDSGSFPWFLVFEEAPARLQVGDDLRQRISFDGFFLKLLAYQAADTMRVAPVLVGRFPPAPKASPAQPAQDWLHGDSWLVVLLVVLTLSIGIRLSLQLRRQLAQARTPDRRPAVVDQIDAESLNRWVERGPDEAERLSQK